MHRRVLRGAFVAVVGTLALVLGTVTAMTVTGTGRALLARTVSAQLDRLVRGNIDVRTIAGSFVNSLTFEDLIVRDTAGVLVAELPYAHVTYQLPALLAGRLVFGLRLVEPRLQLIKRRDGRMNYEEVLRLGEGPPGGQPPFFELRNVEITDGDVTLQLPWDPPDSLRGPGGRERALALERAKPGRVIVEGPPPEGDRRVVRLERLTARLPRITVTTPDNRPLSLRVDSLAVRVSDPAVTVTHLAGTAVTGGDSLAFDLRAGALPNTQFTGAGTLRWPRGPLAYDLALSAPRLALADVRFISPDLPDLRGRTEVEARTRSESRTDFILRDLQVQGAAGRIEGDVTFIQDLRRGLGVRDLRLALAGLDLEAVRPYLDTLPLAGRLSGTVAAEGFRDELATAFDVTFTDARLPERPFSRIEGEGRLHLGGDEGAVFDTLAVRRADLALPTVRLLAPAVALEGRLTVSGFLDGPWRNATFRGTAVHQDGDRPVSTVRGRVRLDARGDTLGISTDVELAPLDFDGIRRGYPDLPSRGDLRGRVRLEGTPAELEVDARVEGRIGAIEARGRVALLPSRFGGDSLRLGFARLDLGALAGRGPRTSLRGEARVDAVFDTLTAPLGVLEVALGAGTVEDVAVDSGFARVVGRDGLLVLDTLTLDTGPGRADGAGTLGWRWPDRGTLRVDVRSDSLALLDSLVLALTGFARDTVRGAVPLGGTVHGELELAGALDTLEAAAEVRGRRLAWQRFRLPSALGSLRWTGGRRPRLFARVTADSLVHEERTYHELRGTLDGWVDSLRWEAGGRLGETARVEAGGITWEAEGGRSTRLDSVVAHLPSRRWRLAAPTTIAGHGAELYLSPLEFAAEDGSGVVRVEGALPAAGGAGTLTVEALGVDIRDVYDLLQHQDTAGVAGSIGANLELGGSWAAPTLRGTAHLADATFGEFQSPFIQGVLDYADRRLEVNMFLWKTGEQALAVEAVLPLDLGLEAGGRRQVDGPLAVRVVADSADLGILEAFTPNLRRVGGRLVADVRVRGTWGDPELSGSVEVVRGSASVPGLGVRFGSVTGLATLAGDSVMLERLRVTSRGGTLDLSGTARLERLTQPELDLRVVASDFQAIEARNFLSMQASGPMRLTGPLLSPTLTGGPVRVNSGVLFFADLINKQIIDLEDPANADLIDLDVLRRRNLGEGIQSRILDSLRIQDLTLVMGDDFWLRSGEANIQLTGSVRVNKVRREYRLDGTLTAQRGTYALKIGFITRDFTVRRGSVTYFGTPDLNAELDIQADHQVRPVDGGDEIPVIAKITGTLQAPRLTLESGATGPPIPQADLVSYLMFGKSSAALASTPSEGGFTQRGVLEATLSYFSTAFSSELERALITDLGLPVDYIEIRPGVASQSFGSGGGLTQLAAGWQIGTRWFVTLNTGFCTSTGQFRYQNPGASFEYRFSRDVRLQTSVEPIQFCLTSQQTETLGGSRGYQVGLDLLWEREY